MNAGADTRCGRPIADGAPSRVIIMDVRLIGIIRDRRFYGCRVRVATADRMSRGVENGRRPAWRVCALVLLVGLALSVSGQMPGGAAAQPKATGVAGEQAAPGFGILDSTQLESMLRQKDFVFVNVHVPYEGEIERTDAFIVFDKIAQSLDKLPPDKSAKIVLYCRSGRMSEIAAAELARLGYTNVSHLAGGMIDWQATDREIIQR